MADDRTKTALEALRRDSPLVEGMAALMWRSATVELQAALRLILSRDDAGELFDRLRDGNTYQSQELEDALGAVRRFVGGD